MSLLDAALLAQRVVYFNTSQTYSQADLLALDLGTADTIVVTGGGTLNFTDVIGANLLKSANIVVTGGSTVNLSAGLLNVSALNSLNFVVDGNSNLTVSSPNIQVGSTLTNLLNRINVEFTGSGDGSFTYVPPDVGLIASATINVLAMGAGDRVIIPYENGSTAGSTAALREFQVDTQYGPGFSTTPIYYKDGKLNLINGDPLLVGLGNTVKVNIAMSQADYDVYKANKDNYLKWQIDTFIYPGDDSGQPPYEAPCFNRGTLIATPFGPRPVEDLQPGDLVLTQDNGPLPIRWISHHAFSALDLLNRSQLRPVRIAAGALGDNMPERALIVSPQHRMLLRSKIAARLFGVQEVLVAAKHLTSLAGIDFVENLRGVDYFHFMLDEHCIVYANGAPTESLYLGPYMHQVMPRPLLDEIYEIFPELAQEDGAAPLPARRLLNGDAARKLAHRHGKHQDRPLIAPALASAQKQHKAPLIKQHQGLH